MAHMAFRVEERLHEVSQACLVIMVGNNGILTSLQRTLQIHGRLLNRSLVQSSEQEAFIAQALLCMENAKLHRDPVFENRAALMISERHAPSCRQMFQLCRSDNHGLTSIHTVQKYTTSSSRYIQQYPRQLRMSWQYTLFLLPLGLHIGNPKRTRHVPDCYLLFMHRHHPVDLTPKETHGQVIHLPCPPSSRMRAP